MEPRLQQQPEARAAALHRLPQLVREPAGRSRYTLLWPCEHVLLFCLLRLFVRAGRRRRVGAVQG